MDINEIKIDWTKFNVKKNDERQYKISKKRYIELVTKLNSINGEIITEFNGMGKSITVRIDDVFITKEAIYIFNDIDRINEFIVKADNNNDEFIGLEQKLDDKFSYRMKIKTFDGEFVLLSSWTYDKFVKGREKFYKKLKENHDYILSGYKGTNEPVNIFKNNYQCDIWTTPEIYCSNKTGRIISPKRTVLDILGEKIGLYFCDIDLVKDEYKSSKAFVECKCKRCGDNIGKRQIKTVMDSDGLLCRFCSDSTSVPNKIMYEVLSSLKINFEPEKRFDWCKFYNKYTNDISHGRYDFAIEDDKLIIEMDGGQHYKDTGLLSYSLEESKFRDKEKDRLALENGYTVIRINCAYKNCDYDAIIKEIQNSNLSLYCDLSNIDADMILSKAMKNIHEEICSLWNNGYNVLMIYNKLQRRRAFIIKSLEISSRLGLCDYTRYESSIRRIIKPCIVFYNNEIQFASSSRADAFRKINKIIRIEDKMETFFARIERLQSYNGFSILYIPKDVYVDYINNESSKDFLSTYINKVNIHVA